MKDLAACMSLAVSVLFGCIDVLSFVPWEC